MNAWFKPNLLTYAVICFSFLITFNSFAQKDPVPTKKGDKWTYSIIGGDYEAVRPFYPLIQTKSAKTLIKAKDGKPIIGARTKKNLEKDTTITEEIGHLAAVKKSGKWGYISKDGKFVVQPKYSIAYDYKNNYAVVAIGEITEEGAVDEHGILDRSGREVVPCKYAVMGTEICDSIVNVGKTDATGTGFGFLHVSDRLIADFKYSQVRDFSNGMAAVERNKRWGFIDKTGKEVITLQFERVFDFSEELAYAYKSLKWGFINKQGKEVIQYQYQPQTIGFGMFTYGLAKVRKNNLEGWIDRNNNKRINFAYPEAHDFSERLACVKTGAKWGYIDISGKLVIPPTFDAGRAFHDGAAAVRIGTKWGFIDNKGKTIIPAKYDEVKEQFKRGIAEVKLGEEYYYIDKTGKEYK